MNKDIKQKWVQALRSGNYKQGFNTLRKEDTFCCLGVLCDLYAKEKGYRWIKNKYSNGLSLEIDGAPSNADVPPYEVMKWAELGLPNPIIKEEEEEIVCEIPIAELNDDLEYDFNKLADLIEEQL